MFYREILPLSSQLGEIILLNLTVRPMRNVWETLFFGYYIKSYLIIEKNLMLQAVLGDSYQDFINECNFYQ